MTKCHGRHCLSGLPGELPGEERLTMRLRLVSVVAALMACSAVQANCMLETFGATICGQGPCSSDRSGKVFCAAEQHGTAVQDDQGEIVCGPGSCVQDILSGRILCSREPGGDAVRTLEGVKCLGGCEPAMPAHCERVFVE